MERPAVLHRRARLRELIEHRFGNRQVDFIAHVANMTTPQRHLNQGMLSQLMKSGSTKAFGEKMAADLARDAGLPANYFDLPLGTLLELPFGLRSEEPAPLPYDAHSAQILRMLADATPDQRAQCLGAVVAVLARGSGVPNLKCAPAASHHGPGSNTKKIMLK